MRLALSILLMGAVTALALDRPEHLDGAVQDGNGLLWAYTHDSPNHLYRFDGINWSDQAAPFSKEGSTPLELAKMTDGSVACLWRLQDKKLGLSIHTADQATELGITEGDIPTNEGDLDTPLADSQNRLWITGEFPRLYCADWRGGLRNIHTFQPDELADPSMALKQYNMFHAVEDGHGRIWVWSDQHWVQHASLRAVFLFTEEKLEAHTEFFTTTGEKIGARSIRCITKADDRHLWISVWHGGVYKMDIDTLKLQPTADPASQMVWDIRSLCAWDHGLFALNLGPYFDHSLWRYQGGEWKKIIPSLFNRPSEANSWLPVKNGVLMMDSIGDPWFLPKEGKPVRLCWQNGFTLHGCRSMAQLPDGHLFAIGRNHEVFCAAFPLPPKEQGNPRITEMIRENNQPWLLDSEGSPWMTFKDPLNSVSKWEGSQWVAYPIPLVPGEQTWDFIRVLLADAEGRIWVVPRETTQSLHIFNTHSKQWQSFQTLQDGFLAIKDPPHFLENNHAIFSPQYSKNHKRCVCSIPENRPGFYYYDGSKWERFDSLQITGNKKNSLEPPWFDQNDNLCVNTQSHITWQLDGSGKWSQIPFQHRPLDERWSEAVNSHPKLEAPEGCVTDRPHSIVRDNHGICWLTWEGGLYKAIPGRCIQVFGPAELTPFNELIRLQQVYVDPEGNALVDTTSPMKIFIIKSKSPPPHTRLTVERFDEDSIRSRFIESSKGEVEFRWQLDDQPWKQTISPKLLLKWLPNGKHTLRVSATDAELQSDAVPATESFTIQVSPEQQMARLINRLSDPDYDRRKEAVEALALQPGLALPALQKERIHANDEKKWWIDAALQRMGISR